MQRIDIIDTIGRKYLITNIENGEYSYAKELNKELAGQKGHKYLDLRFHDKVKNIAVLVETKQRLKETDVAQLFDYVALEQRLNRDIKIVAILADTDISNKIRVWKVWRNSSEELLAECALKSFEEYVQLFERQTYNDEQKILKSTNELNELLHKNGIKEDTRSQFVGTCMLALKSGLKYEDRTTTEILANMKGQLETYLKDSLDKADKLAILYKNVLQDQKVEQLESSAFQEVLQFISDNILPYINDQSTKGQDILSYFFTTFNKYVLKGDKNQAFTPNHIAHFMCKVGGIHKRTRVLDPTCGSGTFLVQAMTQILDECETEAERNEVKRKQIYGIEADEKVYGLATTNMLIHGDGNSNIRCASCFDKADWIQDSNIGLVLMNPPYNAIPKSIPAKYLYGAKADGKEDPTKGLSFVAYVADTVNTGRLVTLLPMQCAIKTNTVIADIKTDLLRRHTLDAVFSFPAEMFYPGASAVACCMVFNLGQPHPKNHKTFFGYFKDDGFEKRKGVGRTDIKGRWEDIENEWLNLYQHRLTEAGLSVMQRIDNGEQEWCAEAYMETDYSTLTDGDFIRKMQDYAAFLISSEEGEK